MLDMNELYKNREMLRKVYKDLFGENYREDISQTRFIYVTTANISYVTTILTRYGIDATHRYSSIQEGLYVYEISCGDEKYALLYDYFVTNGLPVYISNSKLPIFLIIK